MELDLKFCRFESAPWGFRLVGGADFELPLTVVKVTEGGLAEQAGMQVGDTLIRINGESTQEMSHTDVHKTISDCGNNFFLTVFREENQEDDYVDEADVQDTSEIQEISQINSHEVVNNTEESAPEVVEAPQIIEKEVEDIRTKDVESTPVENNTQDACKRSGINLSSEVFQTIKEESWKMMRGTNTDKRKWTTFMQKPNRPIPKSKFDKEVVTEPYRVQIIKQPKPRVAPDRIPTPPSVVPAISPNNEDEPKENGDAFLIDPVTEENEEELLEPPTDSEVPNLEPTDATVSEGEVKQSENLDVEAGFATENQDEAVVEPTMEPEVIEEPKKTEEELLFEKQLSDIQKQLMALSSLPSTIQATLDAVTRQLSGLLPNVKLELPMASNSFETIESYSQEQNAEREGTIEKEVSFQNEDLVESYQDSCQDNNFEREASYEISQETTVSKTEILEENTSECREEDHQQIVIEATTQEERYDEEEFIQEEHSTKSQKDLVLLELEHRQRLIKDRSSKRPPRAFGPLTPQERPLVLPGGRRWRKPKDAFNDEFIADILSSQAELIIGHTLGVNFLKYKKPEKHIDLEKSEVYKVIHSLDHSPRRGIEVRPERVVAEADILSNSAPVS